MLDSIFGSLSQGSGRQPVKTGTPFSVPAHTEKLTDYHKGQLGWAGSRWKMELLEGWYLEYPARAQRFQVLETDQMHDVHASLEKEPGEGTRPMEALRPRSG